MKKNLCSLLIASAISVSGISSAIADTTGTLTFAGSVGSTTCTVENLDKTVSFANLNSAQIRNVGHGYEIDRLDVDYNVSGCPASTTNAQLTVTFPHIGEARSDLGSTNMRGAAVTFKKSTHASNGGFEYPGYTEGFPISNGAGVVTFTPRLIRVTTGLYGATTPVADAFSTTADLTLSFN